MNTVVLTSTPPAAIAPSYLIGVDGGGTGTRVRLADATGRQLGAGEAGPSALGQGAAQAWRHIGEAIAAAAAQAGLADVSPANSAIGLGLSGVSIQARVDEFLSTQPGYALLALDSDGWTTLLGAHAGQPGAVVAAGTGSIGEALRRDGSRVVSGGWGWIGGDEGSGAWLGLKAIAHLQAALDGRAAFGPLAESVSRVAGKERVVILAWKSMAAQAGFATLAPLVFEAAQAGDATAVRFVAEAAAELETLAAALDPQGELPLALSGSIARRMEEHFAPALRARCVPVQGDSASGGLHLVRAALLDQQGRQER